jgi:hypothetical protein
MHLAVEPLLGLLLLLLFHCLLLPVEPLLPVVLVLVH